MPEIPTNHKAAERIVAAAVNSTQLVGRFFTDLDRHIGKQPEQIESLFSAQTDDLRNQAAVAPFQLDRLARGVLSVDRRGKIVPVRITTSPRLIVNFLNQYSGYSPEVLEYGVGNFVADVPEFVPLLDSLSQRHPVVGSATTFLIAGAKNLGWYRDTVEQAAQTHDQASEFFSKLKARGQKAKISSTTQAFLSDLEDDIGLHTAEVLNLANCTAINLLYGSNSGILFSHASFGMPAKDFEHARQEVYALDRSRLISRLSKELFSYLEHLDPNSGAIALPVYTSFVDSYNYLSFLNSFWSKANVSLQDGPLPEQFNETNGMHSLTLGKDISVNIRPLYRNNAQARLVFQGKGDFRNFNLRVDQELERERLGLDFGAADFDDALSYAEYLASYDSDHKLTSRYSTVVDSEGNLKKIRRFYPSITGCEVVYNDGINPVELDGAKKAALLASVLSAQGREVGLRGYEVFSYHSRERISQVPEYYTYFPIILTQIRQLLV